MAISGWLGIGGGENMALGGVPAVSVYCDNPAASVAPMLADRLGTCLLS